MAILLLCWTTLKTNHSKRMRIYNTELKLAKFIHIMLRKNLLNSRQFLEYFGIFGSGLKLQGITKNSTSISQEKFTGYCREFKGK